MRRIIPAILILAALLTVASSALAEEPAKYNFASSQGAKNIQVLPGGEVAGIVYFYNIDGNRITHITLEVSQAPAGWQVEIQPPLAETQVEVNGQVVTVTENLYVEPSEALTEEDKNPPEGMVCIPVATRGYALAKEARIIVRVPDSEEIGTKEEIVMAATASWLGQGGAAAVTQARDFTYTVEVVAEVMEHQEKILGGGNKWLPWVAGATAIVIIGLVTLLYMRRRRD